MGKLAFGHRVDPDYRRRVCKECGRAIHFRRKTRVVPAHWQHSTDNLGIWWRDYDRLYGRH